MSNPILEKMALTYAVRENDRRGHVPGHDGAVKDAALWGLQEGIRIAAEESKGVMICRHCKEGNVLRIFPRIMQLLRGPL